MTMWRAFWRLEVTRRRLVPEAAVLLLLVHVGLRLCSYSRLHRVLGFLASRTRVAPSVSAAGHVEVAWAVTTAGRRLPLKTTCLVEALATDAMLRRRHHASQLRFGVRQSGSGPRLDAHAWVECEGDLVIGIVDNLDDFAPLRSIGS
jgi:transglutaminase superfamily protein